MGEVVNFPKAKDAEKIRTPGGEQPDLRALARAAAERFGAKTNALHESWEAEIVPFKSQQ